MARSSFKGSYMRWNYLLIFIWQFVSSRNSTSDTHTHISLRIRVRLAPLALLSVLLTTARWALCARNGFCFRVVLSGRLTLTGWLTVCFLQMPWLVRPSLPSYPMANLKCRICRIEALVWSRAPDRCNCDEWGLGGLRPQQWPKPNMLLWTCCGDWSKD